MYNQLSFNAALLTFKSGEILPQIMGLNNTLKMMDNRLGKLHEQSGKWFAGSFFCFLFLRTKEKDQ